MAKLRLLLADDHTVVREGLVALINAQPDMEVVAEAGDGRAVIEQVQSCQPDVVIMDVAMPELNGAQATEQVRRIYPNVKVLALSVHEDTSLVRRLLEAGAAGYILKRSASKTLIQAVRTIAAGEIFLDPALTSKVVRNLLQHQPRGGSPGGMELSDREAEVVRLIVQGYSNKEIAEQLIISTKTVETHKTRAMEKLGVANRAGLVRYALQQGWLRDI
jgi:DNA-binding NarL/FixJ family response regulator